MHHQAGGFEDHEQVVVLVCDVQVHGFGRQVDADRVGDFELEAVAGSDTVGGLGHLPAEQQNPAVYYQGGYVAPAEAGRLHCKKAVQPQPCLSFFDRQAERFQAGIVRGSS